MKPYASAVISTVFKTTSSSGLSAKSVWTPLIFFDDVVVLDDLAEDRIMVLKPRRRYDGDKELRAARIGAGIGHSQDTGLAEIKALAEFVGNGLFRAAAAGTSRVTALDHEVGQ